MENGTNNPAAAPPTADLFDVALDVLNREIEAFEAARSSLTLAQEQQAAAIAALPEERRSDLAELEEIADRLRIGALGDEALSTMQAANAALAAVMAVPVRTPRDLFLKLGAVITASWEHSDYGATLLVDARETSLLFGETWLRRWRANGGTVNGDPGEPERILLGQEFDLDTPQKHRRAELFDFLNAIPDGRESVRCALQAQAEEGRVHGA